MGGTQVKIVCPFCKCSVDRDLGDVNRAKKLGNPIYCSKKCSGLARRNNKSIEQKKAEKAEYDRKYREKNDAELRIKRHNWFMQDYTKYPEKYKKERQRRYANHLKYLQTPEYKAWKKEYDQKYRSNKFYGEFGECAIILFEIEKIIKDNTDRFELGYEMKTVNKSQNRKRLCKRTQKNSQQLI